MAEGVEGVAHHGGVERLAHHGKSDFVIGLWGHSDSPVGWTKVIVCSKKLHQKHLWQVKMPTLTFDAGAERFVDDEEANKLVGREYREGHWAALS
jgi:hypothetical protein